MSAEPWSQERCAGSLPEYPGRPDGGGWGCAGSPVRRIRSIRKEHPGDGSGFTLIEVLLALALFAISVVVLASAYVNVLFAQEAVRVDRVFEQEMAFVRATILTAPDRDAIEEGGEVDTAELGTAYWEAELEPTDIADLFVLHITVTLSGTREVEERTLEETLHVLRPGWSDALDREELRAASRERLAELNLNRSL